MMYRSGKGSSHSNGTPVDVVPTTAGIPSTLNPSPRYYREFQSHSRGNTADTAVIPQIPLPCHSLRSASLVSSVMGFHSFKTAAFLERILALEQNSYVFSKELWLSLVITKIPLRFNHRWTVIPPRYVWPFIHLHYLFIYFKYQAKRVATRTACFKWTRSNGAYCDATWGCRGL